MHPVASSIRHKLAKHLRLKYLQIINESNLHCVPKDSETHFKVIAVSEDFQSKSLLQRHRMIKELLKEELDGPIHALSIQAKTPQEWDNSGHRVTKSPPCLGGSGK